MDREAIAQLYQFTHAVLTQNCRDISHEESLRAPAPSGNCLNWVLGHILSTRTPILRLAGQEPIWTAEEAAPYKRGSSPLAPNRTVEARPFESLLADLDRSQERLLAGLNSLTEAQLAADGLPEVPGGLQPVGNQLAIFNFHEAYHAGQTGLLRRIIGKAGAIQ